VRGTTEARRFDHLAMVVRLPLGKGAPPTWLQLDLGGSGGMPDGFPVLIGSPAPRLPGQLHGLLGASARLEWFPPLSDSLRHEWGHAQIGTLGLPNYVNSALIIDFPHQRVAEVPSPRDLSSLLGTKASVVPIQGGYERVLFELSGPNGDTHQALLDTGLSAFPLWTTRALWRELTGLADPGGSSRRYVFSNPRGRLVFVAAPLRIALRVGTWKVPPVEVVYLAEGPEGAALEEWKPKVEAVVAPGLFAGDVILVVDLPHRRLGLTAGRRRAM
jgi:hypothetical protein